MRVPLEIASDMSLKMDRLTYCRDPWLALLLLLLASCTLTRSRRRYWLRRGSRMIVRRENVECCSLVICNNSKHAEVDSLPESSIVTYNHAERCHTISIKDKTYDFKVPNGKEGWPVRRIPHVSRSSDSHVLANTVAKNESMYTKREVEEAKQARDLYRMLAYPSFKDMSEAISSGTHHDTKLKKIHRYLWGTVYGCWTLDIAGHRYDIPSRYWVTQTTKPVAIVVTMSVSMLHTCQNYPSRLLLNLLNQHSTILPRVTLQTYLHSYDVVHRETDLDVIRLLNVHLNVLTVLY